ncbi:MAG: LOG family protein [Candidatus Omnitrophota bacterium]|nr:LOG family protein [Candidatus Omnitrophota bacterium]
MVRIAKEYRVGNKQAQGLIDELLKICASGSTQSLLHEILTSCVKLGMESRDKGDLKLVNNVLKELRYSFKVFSPYRNIKKVIIFGSARSKQSSQEYKMAEEFAFKITKKGFMVITGGGPGVMEAGNKGALPGSDFALNIRLPFEQKPNPYLSEKEKLINFKYFFTRKLIFVKESDATTLFPGGFGTNDEGFEMLTLLQTGKSAPRPILLMEPPGSTYWRAWKGYVVEHLVKNKYIRKEDLNLFHIVTDVNKGVGLIEDFYRVYHSIRYVGDMTILRLNKTLSSKSLRLLNQKFKDILTDGIISPGAPTSEEVQKNEFPDLPRLIMKFNRRDYGRLLQLVSYLNQTK